MDPTVAEFCLNGKLYMRVDACARNDRRAAAGGVGVEREGVFVRLL